jgi:hypothetical protein
MRFPGCAWIRPATVSLIEKSDAGDNDHHERQYRKDGVIGKSGTNRDPYRQSITPWMFA